MNDQLIAHQSFKSIQAGDLTGVELPMLTVLTGPNGSGKSNLLEALASQVIQFTQLLNVPKDRIKLFTLGQLSVIEEGIQVGAHFREPWASLMNTVLSAVKNPHTFGFDWAPGVNPTPDELELKVCQHVVEHRFMTPESLEEMKMRAGKRLVDFAGSDYERYAPFISGVKDPFATSIAEVFLSYNELNLYNQVAQWRLERKGEGEALSDEDFVARYGPKPWELLDSILHMIGLDYNFVPPLERGGIVNFQVLLRDASNADIELANLSSGERLLIAIAMSLYAGSRLREVIELPRLLLLDEADASLHPSMVKSLLSVIERVFVVEHGVRVILTTHSPTTVVLAPPESLYVMSRAEPRLKKAAVDAAIKSLTVGLSTLSVQNENRRQIFVESEIDQSVYQTMFALVKGKVDSPRSAEFIAAGRRDVGGGCDAVIRLVRDLRKAGNSSVSGIIDRDFRTTFPANVFCMSDRHSLESIIFDPLLVGVLLLRERNRDPGALNLPEDIRFFELESAHAVSLAQAVSSSLTFSEFNRDYNYIGGFSIRLDAAYFELQGHELESRILDAYPELRAFKTALKLELTRRVLGDLPQFAPEALIRLFRVALDP